MSTNPDRLPGHGFADAMAELLRSFAEADWAMARHATRRPGGGRR